MADYKYTIGPLIWDAANSPACWRAPKGVVGMLDLGSLPQCGQIGGDSRPVAVLWGPDALGSGYADIGCGDCRNIKVDAALRSAWRDVTGYAPNGDLLVDLIWDHFTNGSDPTGMEFCMPLVPTREGWLELHMEGHSRVKAERFIWGMHSHTAKLKILLQRELVASRKDAIAGKFKDKCGTVALDFHQQIAQALIEKYRCAWDDMKPEKKDWPADEKPKPHSTVLNESFNTANSDTLGPDLSWTEIVGDIDVVSNEARSTTLGSEAAARAESDLSSADHYAEASVFGSTTADGDCGLCSRFSAAAQTYYLHTGNWRQTTDNLVEYKCLTGAYTILGAAVLLAGHLAGVAETLRGTSDGSTITLNQNGVTKITRTDTAIAAGTRCGIRGYKGIDGYCRWDAFAAADLAAPPNRRRRLICTGASE